MRFFFLSLLLLYTGHTEAAIQSKGSHNSLGVLTYQVSPYSYEAGAVLTGYNIDGKGLLLKVQPLGTYAAYSEEILFCGTSTEKLDGKHNPMILTYKTRASRMIRGIGCHELVRVDEIHIEKIP